MSMSDRVVVQGQANWHRSLRVAYGDGWEDGRRELGERIEALEAERDRAIKTRENANAVSIRVEAENRRLKEEIEWLREENGRWREELGLPR